MRNQQKNKKEERKREKILFLRTTKNGKTICVIHGPRNGKNQNRHTEKRGSKS